MAELVLRDITKRYGEVAVIHGIDLTVHDGEFVVFVGPSGCGKSTLLRLIAGLETASGGEVLIDGARVTHLPASDRGLAMVFQSYAPYPHMSVRQNMAFALENMRMPASEITARVDRAAHMLQLVPCLDRKPRARFGGQRQRVAIGRAIMRDPKIFLFDEPLSNLDAELRVATRKELAALHAEIGGTKIYVTHDQVEAMTLAARALRQPVQPVCRRFHRLAENERIAGDFQRKWSDDCRPRRHARCPARAFDLVAPETADLVAQVDLLEQLGAETYLYASAPGLPQLCVRQEGQLRLTRGAAIGLRERRDAIHLFDESGLVWRPTETSS